MNSSKKAPGYGKDMLASKQSGRARYTAFVHTQIHTSAARRTALRSERIQSYGCEDFVFDFRRVKAR
jgi:hypothetical protein